MARCVTMLLIGLIGCQGMPGNQWGSRSDPIPQRVKAVLDQMTMEERQQQLYAWHNANSQTWRGWIKTSWGSLKLSGFSNSSAEPMVTARNAVQQSVMKESRLGIPIAWHQETLLSAAPGATNIPLPITLGSTWDPTVVAKTYEMVALESRAAGADVTYFPELNMYSDPRFGRLQEGFSEDATLTAEMAAASVLAIQGGAGTPTTYLPDNNHTIALAKHWVAYGDAAGGQNVGANRMGDRRFRDYYLMPWERIIKDAGLRGLMPSHQTAFDVPVHGNAWLGQAVLRGALGFDGISVSDCSDVGVLIQWGLAQDSEHAAALGLNATVDMDNECGPNPDGTYTYWHSADAVRDGLLSETLFNASVRRVLQAKFAAGLFDTPYTDPALAPAVIATPAHVALAKQAATEGIILLKNGNFTQYNQADSQWGVPSSEGHGSTAALPINWPSYSSIALIGPLAGCGNEMDSSKNNKASKSSHLCTAQEAYLGKPQHSFGANLSENTPTYAAELLRRVPAGTNVSYVEGAGIGDAPDWDKIQQAQQAAANSDLTVFVAGDTTKSCAEWGDRASLELPEPQGELLARVLAAAKGPVVVVLVHGRPVTLTHNGTDLLPQISGVLATWRGGQTAAVAGWDVLEGKAQPTGRTTQSWLRSVGQIGGPSNPWWHQVNGKWDANHKGESTQVGYLDGYWSGKGRESVRGDSSPLFPFGYGLTYTGSKSIKYESISVSKNAAEVAESNRWRSDAGDKASAALTVSVDLSNSGDEDAFETVQLYLEPPTPWPIARPARRLVGFQRIRVPANSKATAKIAVLERYLQFWLPEAGSLLGSPDAGSLQMPSASDYSLCAGGHSLGCAVSTKVALP